MKSNNESKGPFSRRHRKTAKRDYVFHAHPSVRPPAYKKSDPTKRTLITFDIWVLFENVEKTQASLKSDKHNGYFTSKPIHVYDRNSFNCLEWKMFQTKFAERVKTHILCSTAFLRKSCHLCECGKIWYSQTGHRWQQAACVFQAG